jgi:hypothetical protein
MWTHSRLALSLEDLGSGARLLRDLPGYLRHPLSVEEARTVLRRRLERRETDFLTLLRRIFRSKPAGPYRQLLALAACEEEDLAALTRKEGIEQTLRTLYRHGVYLTVDEFKGRRPVVRGGRTVAMEPGRIRNPGTAAHVPIQAAGAAADGPSSLDLAFLRVLSRPVSAMDARGGVAWRKGHWHVPDGAIVARLLEYASFGPVPERWFSQIDVAGSRLPPRYRWSAHVLRLGGWLAGRRLPAPEHVPLADPLPIARWMHDTLRSGAHPTPDSPLGVGVVRCAFAAG